MDLSNYIYDISNKTLKLSQYLGKNGDIKIDLEDLPNIDKVIISQKCFARTRLKSIIFADINVELDEYHFARQKELQKVKLPKQLKEIPEGCFYGCYKLNDINLNNIEIIRSAAFANTTALKKIDLSHCKRIYPLAFAKCGTIKQANLRNVEYIMEEAFANCYFKNITLNKIKEIDPNAFTHSKFDILTINNECSISASAFSYGESRAIKILKPIKICKDAFSMGLTYIEPNESRRICIINSNYYNENLSKLLNTNLKVLYKESVEKLEEKGFDSAQINQIMKAYEQNIFLSDINIEVPSEIFRKLKTAYEKNPSRTQYLINRLSDKSITLEEKISIYKRIDKIKPTIKYIREKER